MEYMPAVLAIPVIALTLCALCGAFRSPRGPRRGPAFRTWEG